MTEGLRQAGYRVIGAIEIDPKACEVYSLNHPRAHLWSDDIRNVAAADVLDGLGIEPGELDLLGGCPPCQGFSTLRTYNGGRSVHDRRNDLIFDFQRLVLGLKPKCVMLENVPGLYGDRRLTRFKAALSDRGYNIEAKVLDVADYGVPQRRKRLVVLASRMGEVRFAEPCRNRVTVRDAIGQLPPAGRSGDPLHDMPENRAPRTKALIRAVPRDGGSRSALPRRFRLACHTRSNGFKDVYGRMAWDDVAPTITTGCFNPSKGRFLHPTAHRGISMREAALLQSFPKHYDFSSEFGKVCVSSMIGNAIPPEFIKRHARQLCTGSA
ncbi:MAG: DNA cytosine methyltransferase [Phycisphaerales bacterium]|nr:DNA cytosine methyltransferase [Phycisphaerales bacterium]